LLYINLNLFAIIVTDRIEKSTHHVSFGKYWNGQICTFQHNSESSKTEYFYEKVCRRDFKKYAKSKFKFLSYNVGYKYSGNKCSKVTETKEYVEYKKEYGQNIYHYCKFECKNDNNYCKSNYGENFFLNEDTCDCMEKECDPLKTDEFIIPLKEDEKCEDRFYPNGYDLYGKVYKGLNPRNCKGERECIGVEVKDCKGLENPTREFIVNVPHSKCYIEHFKEFIPDNSIYEVGSVRWSECRNGCIITKKECDYGENTGSDGVCKLPILDCPSTRFLDCSVSSIKNVSFEFCGKKCYCKSSANDFRTDDNNIYNAQVSCKANQEDKEKTEDISNSDDEIASNEDTSNSDNKIPSNEDTSSSDNKTASNEDTSSSDNKTASNEDISSSDNKTASSEDTSNSDDKPASNEDTSNSDNKTTSNKNSNTQTASNSFNASGTNNSNSNINTTYSRQNTSSSAGSAKEYSDNEVSSRAGGGLDNKLNSLGTGDGLSKNDMEEVLKERDNRRDAKKEDEISSIGSDISDFISNMINSDLVNKSFSFERECTPIETISINYHGKEIVFMSQNFISKYMFVEFFRDFIIFVFAFLAFQHALRNN